MPYEQDDRHTATHIAVSRNPGHRASLADPPLRRGPEHGVGHRESGQECQHGEVQG
jgi:hypothetical protein